MTTSLRSSLPTVVRRLVTTSALACALAAAATAQVVTFDLTLSGVQEVPPVLSAGTGSATVTLDTSSNMVTVTGTFSNLNSTASDCHIHGPAPAGRIGGIVLGLGFTRAQTGSISGSGTLTSTQAAQMLAGLTYINVHSNTSPSGEIRGQICPDAVTTFRNTGGTNPASFTANGSAGGAAVLGGTLSLFVDASGTTGHRNSTILGFLTPTTQTLGGGQVLLINAADPNGEILNLGLQGGDTAIVGAPLPNDLTLCGLTLYTQGLHILGVRPFALSNALDFLVGF
jgi:hypothetical protein